MSALNPHHPVTKAAEQHWHKIAALIMVKLGVSVIEITERDIDKLDGNLNIVLDERGSAQTKSFKVRIVDNAEATRLAAQEGGLPFRFN